MLPRHKVMEPCTFFSSKVLCESSFLYGNLSHHSPSKREMNARSEWMALRISRKAEMFVELYADEARLGESPRPVG